MSFLIPKKPQILYAPMLSSFGGGSARGFNPGGGDQGWFPVDNVITLTSASVTGRDGPSSAQLSTAYGSEWWYDDTVTFDDNGAGIQKIIALPAGSYEIELWGARGGTVSGAVSSGMTQGAGAKVKATYSLSEGSDLYVLVGQCGVKTSGSPESQPGGGATWFWVGNGYTGSGSATVYGVAGGGGGATNANGTGEDAPSNVTGENSDGLNNGGAGGSTDYSSGGAGWSSSAANTSGLAGTRVAQYPPDGGGGFQYNDGSDGGFGGGGGNTNNGNNRGGAGAGYTGGAGKNAAYNNAPSGCGGGGSKLVGATTSGSHLGNNANQGQFKITRK